MPPALATLFDRREVAGIPIFIVDEHHKVLAPWALERRRRNTPQTLLTIDFHMDASEAFRRQAFLETEGAADEDVIQTIRNSYLSKLDWSDDASLFAGIALLANDEHIFAATGIGILSRAFCLQLDQQSSSPLGERQPDGIYVLGGRCAIACERPVYDDECAKHHALEIVEGRYLEDQLARADAIANSLNDPPLETETYILDVDLDCFRSWAAIQPRDPSVLHRLIRGASIVTIATEPEFVELGWQDDKPVSHEGLLTAFLKHIEQAVGGA